PTHANVYVPDGGTFGIVGNELLTFNAAGTVVFSGCDVGVGVVPVAVSGALVLELENAAGSEVIIGRSGGTITTGDFIAGLAFKNLDTSGTPPHYAGIKARADSDFGTMELEFYAGRGQYEADTPQMVISGTIIGQVSIQTSLGVGVADPHSALEVAGAISSATLPITIANDGDGIDIAGVNTLLVDGTGGDITITGFINGVIGQYLTIARINTTNSLILQHDSSAHQDIILHKGGHETVTDWGGFYLVCDGTDWYDVSHAKHV
ncbi:unnamed protein product, partial [marine sediment metagenome]